MPKRKRPFGGPSRPSNKLQHSHSSAVGPTKLSRNTAIVSSAKSSRNNDITSPHAPTTIPTGTILLVGEGDFSFSRALLSYHQETRAGLTHPAHHRNDDDEYTSSSDASSTTFPVRKKLRSLIHATTPETRSTLFAKHARAGANVQQLEEANAAARVSYGIDARKLASYAALRRGSKRRRRGKPRASSDGSERGKREEGWDWIVFQFPHVGGLSTDMRRQVRANQELLSAFLRAAKGMLRPAAGRSGAQGGDGAGEFGMQRDSEGGRVMVTLFEGMPYEMWNIRDLARNAGLRVVRSERFEGHWWRDRGYRHARTFGDVVGKAHEEGEEEEEGDDDWDGFSDGIGADEVEEKEKKRPGKWRGEERLAKTYIFGLKKDDEDGVNSKNKRKHRAESESDD